MPNIWYDDLKLYSLIYIYILLISFLINLINLFSFFKIEYLSEEQENNVDPSEEISHPVTSKLWYEYNFIYYPVAKSHTTRLLSIKWNLNQKKFIINYNFFFYS